MSELKHQALFEHMQDEHGLMLVESELADIAHLVMMGQSSDYAALQEARKSLREAKELAEQALSEYQSHNLPHLLPVKRLIPHGGHFDDAYQVELEDGTILREGKLSRLFALQER